MTRRIAALTLTLILTPPLMAPLSAVRTEGGDAAADPFRIKLVNLAEEQPAAVGLDANGPESGGVAPRQACPGNVCVELETIFDANFESQGAVTIRFLRVGSTNGAVSVDYTTLDGLAIAGADYVATSGTVRWGNGDGTPKAVAVQVIDDAGAERLTESFNVRMSNPTGGAQLGGDVDFVFVIIDDDAFPPCTPDATTLCLNQGGRFQVQAEWRDFLDNLGAADAFDIGKQDSGLFYFIDENNIEMLVKVLDACDLVGFNSFWFFYAATTNLGFTLTVFDFTGGQINIYFNPIRNAAPPIQDTSAFETCP